MPRTQLIICYKYNSFLKTLPRLKIISEQVLTCSISPQGFWKRVFYSCISECVPEVNVYVPKLCSTPLFHNCVPEQWSTLFHCCVHNCDPHMFSIICSTTVFQNYVIQICFTTLFLTRVLFRNCVPTYVSLSCSTSMFQNKIPLRQLWSMQSGQYFLVV